jgi:hypothetical protein
MTRLRDWWVDHPLNDYLTAVLVMAVVWRSDVAFGEPGRPLLQAFVGLSTAVAGFSTLTVSLVASLNHPQRLRTALGQVGHRLARLVVVGILSLWLAAVVFASAIALNPSSRVPPALFALAGCLASLALARSVYLLLLMMRALMPSPTAPPPWVEADIVLPPDDPVGYDVPRVVPVRGGGERADPSE